MDRSPHHPSHPHHPARNQPSPPMDRKEAAVYLGVSTRTITRWVSRGIMPTPTITLTGKRYWSRDSLEKLALKVRHSETE
jgi:excisionase family DNA binding protein